MDNLTEKEKAVLREVLMASLRGEGRLEQDGMTKAEITIANSLVERGIVTAIQDEATNYMAYSTHGEQIMRAFELTD